MSFFSHNITNGIFPVQGCNRIPSGFIGWIRWSASLNLHSLTPQMHLSDDITHVLGCGWFRVFPSWFEAVIFCVLKQ